MTSPASPSLYLDRLEKVRRYPGKIIARCPACGEDGKDRTGNHLVLFDNGAFSCVIDEGHTQRIRELVGVRRPLAPVEREQRREEFIRRKQEERENDRRRQAARKALPELVRKWRWQPAELWGDSPTHPDEAADDPRSFVASLFDPEAVVWTGEVYQSGENHADRWRNVSDWFNASAEEVGPMIAPSTWKPGTVSRKQENIIAAPFIVLDFDGKPGWKPRDQSDLDRHVGESLAIVRWLHEDRGWNLAAIVHTGNKSIHAWFAHPGETLVEGLRQSLEILGIDKSLIGHPEHPARLPGQVHAKSGNRSRVLWLK
jgi:hypothetical protein